MAGIQEYLSNIRNLSKEKDTLIQSLEAENRQASLRFELTVCGQSQWSPTFMCPYKIEKSVYFVRFYISA